MKHTCTGKRTALLCALMIAGGLAGKAQTAAPFGFENNQPGTWTGTASSETASITGTAAQVRTGAYALKLTTTSTGTGSKQWYGNDPFAASASGTYIHFIYWARAQDPGTSVDASLRYSATTPPTGSGSSANAASGVAITTTGWTRVTNSVTTSSSRYYFPGPRKTASAGATAIYLDDGVVYTSPLAAPDTTDPLTPGTLGSTVNGNLVNLSWVTNTDAGTGVQEALILRTANTTAAAPVLNDQARYSTAGGSTGPNTTGPWTVVGTATATATTYLDAVSPPGNYLYAVVLRDLAYNYSLATVSGTVTVGTPTPTILLNQAGYTGSLGNTVRGTYSPVASYGLSGLNLTGNITITAPPGFEVSLSATAGFAASLTLMPASGIVNSTPVYVRFAPAAATGNTGNLAIAHTTPGGSAQSVTVSGNALDVEPTAHGTIAFGAITDTRVEIHLPTAGNGNRRIIIVNPNQDVSFSPADGSPVSGVHADFSQAAPQNSGDKVVYDGGGSGNNVVTVAGLSPSTTYYFAVFEYNAGTGTSQNYLPQFPYTAIARTASFPLGTGNAYVGRTGAVTLFPNPSRGRIQVQTAKEVRLTARDAAGRMVAVSATPELDLSELPDGVYLISVTDPKGMLLKNERILKQK